MGIFADFIRDPEVRLVGVEAGGRGGKETAASVGKGSPGVLHGSMSYILQDSWGQILGTHSISAGLDYPGVGPEHSYLKEQGRATYTSVTDHEALEAFRQLSQLEGIIPALESAHAIAYVLREGASYRSGGPLLVCLSGRGDKDVAHVARVEGRGLPL